MFIASSVTVAKFVANRMTEAMFVASRVTEAMFVASRMAQTMLVARRTARKAELAVAITENVSANLIIPFFISNILSNSNC